MYGAIRLSPNTPSWRGAQLKHRNIFTFYHPSGGFPIRILCTFIVFPIRATSPAHCKVLDFITLTVLVNLYKSSLSL